MSKKISTADMKKMMASLKRDKAKPKKRVPPKTTTDDLIALKKIKLLQEGKTSATKAAPAASNLASRVNFNADKVHAKADRLIVNEKPKTKVPENFFDDKKEMEAKKDQIEMETDSQIETEDVFERPNKRLESGQKGVKVKGIGIAKNLPQGFFDDKTKDANIRGVETPADKEAREMTEFKDAINEEMVKSHQMLEEDDESQNLAKDIVEVDLQMSLFTKTKSLADRAAALRAKREELRNLEETQEMDASDSDSDTEIDWRQQNIF